jgi:hypothetical protein
MLSGERFYREREDAAEALLPSRNRGWWQQTIVDLRNQGTDDATRLARRVIELIDCGVTDESLVSTLFAELGATISPLPKRKKKHTHSIRTYTRIFNILPPERLASVLNTIADYIVLLRRDDWRSWQDTAEIVANLMVRAIDEKVVRAADAAALWRWLAAFCRSERSSNEAVKDLKNRLNEKDDIRRAVQLHALYTARPEATIWRSEFELRQRLVALSDRQDDVIWFLDRLAGTDNRDPTLREEWSDLMAIGIRHGGLTEDLRATAAKFQRGDPQLDAFVRRLENPIRTALERKQERQAARHERKRKINFETHRREYAAQRAALRKGELGSIISPARAYLGQYGDLTREQPPADRIAEWLGTSLRDDTMAGLEAVLHRTDLSTDAEIAQGFADEATYNYCYAILAGLLARQRAGKGFADLSPEVRTVGLLLCHNNHYWCAGGDIDALRESLEMFVIPAVKDRQDFAKLWIEPSLAAGRSHVSGLYMLAHDEKWQAAGAALAGGWLTAFPNVPENVELELIDCLTHSGDLATLASIAAARAGGPFRSSDHELAWLAIDVLVRFDTVLPNISGIGRKNPEFIWFLRNRLQLRRHGSMLTITPAQAKWIVSEFRQQWPYAVMPGSASGDTNPHDATDFLRALIGRLANDTGAEAIDAMRALMAEPDDSYSEQIRHMAAEQRQKYAEEHFSPLRPKELGELLAEGPPSNADDLNQLKRIAGWSESKGVG